MTLPQPKRAENPYLDGPLAEVHPDKLAAPLAEGDTQAILRLCDEAQNADTLERNRIIAKIYALNWDDCETEAVEAMELLTYALIVNPLN